LTNSADCWCSNDGLVFFFLFVVPSSSSFSNSFFSQRPVIHLVDSHMMNFYDLAFVALVSVCSLLTWRQYYAGEKKPEEKALNQPPVTSRAKEEASQFTRVFFAVYCLVMGSDWLQGRRTPYLQQPSLTCLQAHIYTVYIKINLGSKKRLSLPFSQQDSFQEVYQDILLANLQIDMVGRQLAWCSVSYIRWHVSAPSFPNCRSSF
jgi:hypothetical protein